MAGNKKILIIRLSSIGDVAIAVPLVKALSNQYPTVEISIVSKPFHQFMFEGIPRVQFIPFDDKKYIGFMGTFRFAFDQLWKENFTHVIDLHDVLRSKLFRKVLSIKAIKTVVFDKGRKEKKAALLDKSKLLKPLQSSFLRYKAAIETAGFQLQTEENQWIEKKGEKENYTIGIAPFSLHFTKTYPQESMVTLINSLLEQLDCNILLFGGKSERDKLATLSTPDKVAVANCQTIQEEMQLMSTLDVMISMDSANMHLASLVEVPVVSIWGGTHPNMGFYGYRQNPALAIGKDLACRPCSVFGKETCPLGHFECMKTIDNQQIVDKVIQVVKG